MAGFENVVDDFSNMWRNAGKPGPAPGMGVPGEGFGAPKPGTGFVMNGPDGKPIYGGAGNWTNATAEANDFIKSQAQARAMNGGVSPAAAAAAPAEAGVAGAAGAAAAAPGYFAREMPTLSRFMGGVGGLTAKASPYIVPALEAKNVYDTVQDPSATGLDVAGQVAAGTSRAAGAAAGGMWGAKVPGPVWAKAIGAGVGGLVGYAVPELSDRYFGTGGRPSAAAAEPTNLTTPTPVRALPPPSQIVEGATVGPSAGMDEAAVGRANLAAANSPGFGVSKIFRDGNSFSNIPGSPGTQVTGYGAVPSTRSSGPMGGPDANPTSPGYRPSAVSGNAGTVNTISAANFGAPTIADSAALSGARQAAAARGDWDAVRASYQTKGGTWQGTTAAQDTNKANGKELFEAVRNARTVGAKNSAVTAFDAFNKNNALQANATSEQTLKYMELMRKGKHDDAQLLLDTRVKGATADEADAKAATTRAYQVLAAQHLKENPGDRSGAALILAGRAPTGEKFVFPPNLQPIPGGKGVPMAVRANNRTGVAENVPIVDTTKVISLADLKQKADAKGETLAQAMARVKALGGTVQ